MAQHLNDNWLKSCIQELDLPGSPWHEVKELISPYLVGRIRIEGLRSGELAKLRYLLGREFTSNHKLIRSEVSPDVARPNFSDEKLEKLLKDVTLKAAKDAKCSFQNDPSQFPESFQKLLSLATDVFRSSLESCMQSVRMSQFKQYGSNTSVIALSSFVEKDIEILGEAVVKILQKQPSRLQNVSRRLQGRLLPTALRRLLYRLVLINKRKQSGHPGANLGVGVLSSDDRITQQGLRENFARGTKRGMQDLKLKDPAKSPLRHLIHLSVIEAYGALPGLQPHSSNIEIQKECSIVLNIFYTYAKSFQHSYVLWLFPLQVTISQDRYAEEHSYNLAMWFDCLVKSCLTMNAKALNARVLNVWRKCFSSGDELMIKPISDHFQKIGLKCDEASVIKILDATVPSMNETDTDIQALLSHSLHELQSKSNDTFGESLQAKWTIITHPVLCLRRWLFDLFVSITDFPVAMFLWDQFFLRAWEAPVLEIACCSLMYAMRDVLLGTPDTESLCANMMEKTKYVTLVEIHKAWREVCPKFH